VDTNEVKKMVKKFIDRSKVRSKSLRIRVTEEEHEKIKLAAEKEKVSVSELLRDRTILGIMKR
jgi:predicted HicB family RNase H-like nuclease